MNAEFEVDQAESYSVALHKARSAGCYEPEFSPGARMVRESVHRHAEQVMRPIVDLRNDRDPQVHGLGINELWEIPESRHVKGMVMHTAGWPLTATPTADPGCITMERTAFRSAWWD